VISSVFSTAHPVRSTAENIEGKISAVVKYVFWATAVVKYMFWAISLKTVL